MKNRILFIFFFLIFNSSIKAENINIEAKNITLNKNQKSSFFENKNQWIVLLVLCSISVILTPFFEIEAASSGIRYSEFLFPSFMDWLGNSSWVPILVGIGLASGFLHYYMDRAVYRFSDYETRMRANKLLFSR